MTGCYAAGLVGITTGAMIGAMRDAGPHLEQPAEDPDAAGQPLRCFEVRDPSECGEAGQYGAGHCAPDPDAHPAFLTWTGRNCCRPVHRMGEQGVARSRKERASSCERLPLTNRALFGHPRGELTGIG